MTLFPELDEPTSAELDRLCGTLLRGILSNPDEKFAVVIDALDESLRYSSPHGLIQLTNELEELRCPVVLITRKEHFDATFGNFEMALSELTRGNLSIKGGAQREAMIFSLESWTTIEVKEFLSRCIEEAKETEQQHIERLLKMATDGRLAAMFGDLQNHPLFLQMLVDIASEGQSTPRDPAMLIERWSRQKIRRDISVGRPLPWPVEDASVFVDDILRLMEDVAAAMVQVSGDDVTLRDDLSTDEILLAVAARGHGAIEIVNLVNTSLLVPVERRTGKILKVRFYHRVLQDYFLARYLVNKEPSFQVPKEVAYWQNAIASR